MSITHPYNISKKNSKNWHCTACDNGSHTSPENVWPLRHVFLQDCQHRDWCRILFFSIFNHWCCLAFMSMVGRSSGRSSTHNTHLPAKLTIHLVCTDIHQISQALRRYLSSTPTVITTLTLNHYSYNKPLQDGGWWVILLFNEVRFGGMR